MPLVVFEHTIQVFEQAKTVPVLDRAAIFIGFLITTERRKAGIGCSTGKGKVILVLN
jgi:hypothetical protein